MDTLNYSKYNLRLFDGAGASAGASGTSSAGGEGANTQAGDTNTNPNVYTPRSKKSGAYDNVVFGKQEESGTSKAETQTDPAAEGETKSEEVTPEQREKAYRDFIEAHKDLYTKDTQNMINKRFKETKQLQETNSKQKAVLDQIAKRYNIQDGDLSKIQEALDNDNDYWERAAQENGYDDVDTYRTFEKLKRENAEYRAREENAAKVKQVTDQMAMWQNQANEVKAKFPQFDLETETSNAEFMTMIKSGVPMEHAYKVAHYDELMQSAVSKAEAEKEKQVVSNIRAKGARPAENGVSRTSSFTVKDDVHKLTRADRAEAARRAMRGETIKF